METSMLRKLVIAGVIALSLPVPAFAANVMMGGPRIGFSVDPDQIVVGGQLEVGDVAPKISFDPNLELGFGDDMNVIAFEFDLHYHFKLKDSDWIPYVGAGIALNFVEVDRPAPDDDSDTDVGGHFIFGAAVPLNRAPASSAS